MLNIQLGKKRGKKAIYMWPLFHFYQQPLHQRASPPPTNMGEGRYQGIKSHGGGA